MDRHDWTCIGLRLYGAYLLVQAVIGLPATILTLSGAPFSVMASLLTAQVLSPAFFGALLFLGAGRIVDWLRARDGG